MKLSDDFVLRRVMGQTLLVPVGAQSKTYNGVFTMSETGAFLLDAFAAGDDVDTAAGKLAASFDVPPAEAADDARAFARRLLELGVLLSD